MQFMTDKFQETDKTDSYKNKWLPIMSLAMSLPTTILVTAWGAKELYEAGYLSQKLSFLLFFLITTQTLVIMVIYAFRKKNKS